ncbi:hypothetical protein EBZ80_13085 [bacterium]|nr:hypothetical protein [bacterium]
MLAIRRGTSRIMDQDVGALLEMDPADCSHWKKGKKHIRSVMAIQTLAERLQCDQSVVSAVATGQMDDTEALLEVKGHGAFELDAGLIESTCKEMQRQHPEYWSRERERAVRTACHLDAAAIQRLVAGIHRECGIEEAPVFLPEIVRVVTKENPGFQFELIPEGRESRPWYRFEMARQLGRLLLRSQAVSMTPGRSGLPVRLQDHLRQVEENTFAMELLAPLRLVRQELARSDAGRDIIDQLAERFWLSRAVMNRRVRGAIVSSSGN